MCGLEKWGLLCMKTLLIPFEIFERLLVSDGDVKTRISFSWYFFVPKSENMAWNVIHLSGWCLEGQLNLTLKGGY